MNVRVHLVASQDALAEVGAAAARAPRVAVDVEGNGLYAYRPKLCTVQLAWEEGDTCRVAIVDTLAVSPSPLRYLLGSCGPLKLLHDLTFDARALGEAGVVLERVQDTSVMARMLGRQATGLAALLAEELGITVSKALQQHDWSHRPLDRQHIDYLATDVVHLHALSNRLLERVRQLDIENEVADECAFKLESALAPPRRKERPHLRLKGAQHLGAAARERLRALVDAREALAERLDLPPFKLVPNGVLLEVAARNIRSAMDLPRARSGFADRHLQVLAEVFEAAQQKRYDSDDDAPPPAAPSRAELELGRARHRRLVAWRRIEARARGVDEQVVLPGHCLQELAALEAPSLEHIAAVAGLGKARFNRYGAALEQLLTEPDSPPPTAGDPAA